MKFYFVVFSMMSHHVLANLLITPTRVDMTSNNKSASITIVNQSSEENTFRISYYNLIMKEDGSYQELKEPREDAKLFESRLKYSPKQMTLKPGESQNLKLSILDFNNIPNGEYRTHLLFTSEPSPYLKTDSQKNGGISISLTVTKGISIPVILKLGDLNASVSKIEFSLKNKNQKTEFCNIEIFRDGLGSVFGNVEIIGSINDKELTLFELKGISVFPEIKKRNLKIPTNNIEYFKKAKNIYVKFYKRAGDEVISEIWAKSNHLE